MGKADDRIDVLGAIKDYSKQVSDIVRQMALAGIAVAWMFKATNVDAPTQIERGLALPVLACMAALTLDFLQYLYGAIAWRAFNRYYERRGKTPTDAPVGIVRPITFFWSAKVVAILVAYWWILRFFTQKIVFA